MELFVILTLWKRNTRQYGCSGQEIKGRVFRLRYDDPKRLKIKFSRAKQLARRRPLVSLKLILIPPKYDSPRPPRYRPCMKCEHAYSHHPDTPRGRASLHGPRSPRLTMHWSTLFNTCGSCDSAAPTRGKLLCCRTAATFGRLARSPIAQNGLLLLELRFGGRHGVIERVVAIRGSASRRHGSISLGAVRPGWLVSHVRFATVSERNGREA